MRRIIALFLSFILLPGLLAACSAIPPTETTPTPSNAAQPSLPGVSQTPNPSGTPRWATASPTITNTRLSSLDRTVTANAQRYAILTQTAAVITVTVTPTFDVQSMRTSTANPPAACPPDTPNQVPTLAYNGDFRISVIDRLLLDYLNQFGVSAFLQADRTTRDMAGELYPHVTHTRDLTNDGVPEIVFSFGRMYIFGCHDGQYQTLLATELSAHGMNPHITAIKDLNQNGIPELLVYEERGTQADSYYEIYEWDGMRFSSLFSDTGLEPTTLWLWAYGRFEYSDVDRDGMTEIVVHGGFPLGADYNGTAPWREITYYYKWNGALFVQVKKFLSPPEYRYQAVVDADYAVLSQAYDQALALYQQAIFDDQLEWWTPERHNFLFEATRAASEKRQEQFTPPAPDPGEYYSLAAYARFRIMLLHLTRGYDSDAEVVYQTLLKKFPQGSPGAIYAEMARAVWVNYAANHNLASACQLAREVAAQNPDEAIRYLRDDYIDNGYGKPPYTVEQLCPYQE